MLVRGGALAVVVPALLTACGPEAAEPEGPFATAPASPSPATEPATPESTSPPPDETVPTPMIEEPENLLTEADDGAQVAIGVGEEVPLRLDNDWTWGEPQVEGDAVSLSRVDYLVDPGFVEWIVVGRVGGSATVEVEGEPACGDPSDCPPSTVRIDFEVEG